MGAARPQDFSAAPSRSCSLKLNSQVAAKRKGAKPGSPKEPSPEHQELSKTLELRLYRDYRGKALDLKTSVL